MTPIGARPWHRYYDASVDRNFVPDAVSCTDLLDTAFRTHRDRVMLEYYGTYYSYADIRSLAARAAAAIKAHGIGRGDRVALHLPNCPWHPIFFFGALAAGATVTHLSPLDADREIAHKLTDSGARLLISLTTPEFTSALAPMMARPGAPAVVQCPDIVSARGRDCPVSAGAIALETFWDAQDGAGWAPEPVTTDDIALLQYTGGTTGLPKAAVLTHGNLSAAVQIYMEATKDQQAMSPGKSHLAYAPLFHIMGLVAGLLKRTCEGGRQHLRQRFNAEDALREIEEKRINGLGGVPTLWIALLQVPDIESRDLSSLEYVGSGGAPLPVEVYNRWLALTGLRIGGGWGMTESAAPGTLVPEDMPEEKLGSIGVPLPAIDMRIVAMDDPGRALPPGQEGEIALRGPNLLSRYWNKPEATAEAFHDGWFLTGDVGYMDEDGFFYLVDRKKDVILSGGFNVYPLMIENAVHEHPDVAEAIAVGVPDSYRGESAKVFVVLRDGAARFTLDALQGFLSDKLGRHELPRHLEFRTALPHTAVGKPDRKALRNDASAEPEPEPEPEKA